ncbi:MAG: HlyD family efflux transporter periplasmic adaptor subunit [Planctomycetota bacterium]
MLNGHAPRWFLKRRSLHVAAATCVLLWLGAGSAQVPSPDATGADRVAVVLAPRRQAVLSAQVPARVTDVRRDMGEPFDAGDVLVQLEDLTYRVNEQMAAAELAAAETELQHVRKLTEARSRERHAEAVRDAARANLAATQRLFDNSHASQVDLEAARRDVRTAEAECELVAATAARELNKAEREAALARARLELARHELAGCTVGAPYDGRVARVLVHEHERVERGAPLIEVVDDRVLLAKFLVPSALFRCVARGRELRLTVNETGGTVTARVSHVAAVLDPASVTFEVHAEIDNAAGELRAGMNAWLAVAELRGR